MGLISFFFSIGGTQRIGYTIGTPSHLKEAQHFPYKLHINKKRHDGMYVPLQDFRDTLENLNLSFLSYLLSDLIMFLDYKNSLFDLRIKDIRLISLIH